MLPNFSEIFHSYYFKETYVPSSLHSSKLSSQELAKDEVVIDLTKRDVEARPQFFDDQCEYSSLEKWDAISRYQMGERIKAILTELGIKVVIPEERVINSSKGAAIASRPISHLPSQDESIKIMITMTAEEKIKLARDLSLLIRKIGLVNTQLDNIRIGSDRTIYIVDVSPYGLIGKMPQSIEKCARLGLYTLSEELRYIVPQTNLQIIGEPNVNTNLVKSATDLSNKAVSIFTPMTGKYVNGIKELAVTIDEEYEKYIAQNETRNYWFIIRPFIALANAIRAYVRNMQLKGIFNKITKFKKIYYEKIKLLKIPDDKKQIDEFKKEYLTLIGPLAEKFFMLREKFHFNRYKGMDPKNPAMLRSFIRENLYSIFDF